MEAAKFNDHIISVEDAQSGYIFHFAVGETKGFRYLGVQTDPPQPCHQLSAKRSLQLPKQQHAALL